MPPEHRNGGEPPTGGSLTILEPHTPETWQQAVDLAHGALALDAARSYDLVHGGPVVNVDRCLELLERGQEIGITPREGSIENFVRSIQT